MQYDLHWHMIIVILIIFSSLTQLEVVKLTTSSVASDWNYMEMTTFIFQSNSIFLQWSGC